MYEEHEIDVIQYKENIYVVASDDGTLGGGGSGGTSGGELPDGSDDE